MKQVVTVEDIIEMLHALKKDRPVADLVTDLERIMLECETITGQVCFAAFKKDGK